MNNMYDAPAGSGPGYGAGPGPGGVSDPSGRSPAARARRKRAFRWGAGITLAGFLAGGGIALAATSGSSPSASAAATTSQSQGATLNSALSTAGSSAVPLPRLRRALARLRALGGVDGQFTFHNKTGYHTLAFERGSIQSVNGSNLVVRAPDGTTWAWVIVSDTVVRQNGSKTTTGALSPGEAVFVGGPVINGSRDARVIVVRTGGSGSPSSGSASPSSGSGSPSSGSGSPSSGAGSPSSGAGSSSSVSGPAGTSVS